MKNTIITIVLFFLLIESKAQQFVEQFRFTDSVGNEDTLFVGYDLNATDTIDAIFGELNIINKPFKTGLDVRQGNIWSRQNLTNFHNQTAFQTKTQIFNGSCGATNPIEIDVVSSNWPVTIRWNNMSFMDTCKNGSVFTSVHPGGWWDTGGFIEELETNNYQPFYKNQYYFMSGLDTVSTYWFGLADSTLLTLSANNIEYRNEQMTIYPNPTNGKVNIKLSKRFDKIKSIEVFSFMGQKIMTFKNASEIDLSTLSNCIYFITVTNYNGEKCTQRVGKK